MRLRPITLAEAQLVREWRNDPEVLPMLRTGYKSEAEQEAWWREWCDFPWYRRVWWWVLGKTRTHRYYAIEEGGGDFAGITGLTYIDGDEAEISLVLGPEFRGKGLGALAIDLVLDEAWRLGLRTVRGECYRRGAMGFWRKQVETRPSRFYIDFAGSLHWKWTRP